MGLTPLEGLIMGTRSGDVDPAVVQFICNHENISVDEMLTILNKKSGLLGMTGISSDFRDVRKASEEGNEKSSTCTGCLQISCGQIHWFLCSSTQWCGCNHIYSRCW